MLRIGSLLKEVSNTKVLYAVLALCALAASCCIPPGFAAESSEHFRFQIEAEAGPAWQSRNDVQIPNNDTATRFSLVDIIGSGPFVSGRLYLTWNIKERHACRILLAPLSISDRSNLTKPVTFEGKDFTAGEPIEATYQFNSWRATYRYRLWQGEQLQWWIGFTAKIRDARIELEQQDVKAAKTDLGFVPLLNLAAHYNLNPKWTLLFDLDGLAGGPGRAEDVSLKLNYQIYNKWNLSFGYRTVEGGADVDDVYTFAWFHYGIIALNRKW